MNSSGSFTCFPAARLLTLLGSIAALSLPLSLSACLAGPNYHRPGLSAPSAFKEAALTPPPDPHDGSWKAAQPASDQIRGNWWELYNDPQLNALEDKVTQSNQNLKAAYQSYLQSRSQIKVDRASLFPTLGVQAQGSRQRVSDNRPFVIAHNPYSDIVLDGTASWEPDLWGRVRRTVESATASAQASKADLANVQLSLQSELAIDYFQLRGLDTQQQILDITVTSYKQYLKLTQRRFQGGVASASDLALAQTQLDQTDALATDIGVARAQFEHAVATLTGTPASSFSLPPAPLQVALPEIPVGLPSGLLERRPDVASAERRAAAANAQIGIAQSAFYPNLSLNSGGGFESVNPGTLIQGPAVLWTLGASAAETLFDAGRRHAIKQQAIAAYEQNAANYRETVLQSFQDVEDSLSTLRLLNRESGQQAKAVTDAQRSLNLATLQYKRGLTNYLLVISSQAAALANQRTQVDITTRQATASVQLIKALGGGWDSTQLRKP